MVRNLLLVISFIFASINVFATENKDTSKEATQTEKKDEVNAENSVDAVKKDKKEEKK